MAGEGPAVVLVAQPDPDSRELLARVAESAGHRAVRLDDATPPGVVDASVHELALVVVIDIHATSLDDLAAITDAFATRGYPAAVVALVDGPATEERAQAAGARRVLCRPFHDRDLVHAIDVLLHPERVPAETGPDTEPDTPRTPPVGAGHAFTDILRMGRQL